MRKQVTGIGGYKEHKLVRSLTGRPDKFFRGRVKYGRRAGAGVGGILSADVII